MLKLVLKNVTFTSCAAEAPRVFTTESTFASALMKGRVSSLLGYVDEMGTVNDGNFLNPAQKELVLQYVKHIEQKLLENNIECGNVLAQFKVAAKNIDISKAPRSPVELAGHGALILLPLGQMIMIYQILDPFKVLMLDRKFCNHYYNAVAGCNGGHFIDELNEYIERTAVMAGFTEPSAKVVPLETIVTEDVESLARSYAVTRVFGMEE